MLRTENRSSCDPFHCKTEALFHKTSAAARAEKKQEALSNSGTRAYRRIQRCIRIQSALLQRQVKTYRSYSSQVHVSQLVWNWDEFKLKQFTKYFSKEFQVICMMKYSISYTQGPLEGLKRTTLKFLI